MEPSKRPAGPRVAHPSSGRSSEKSDKDKDKNNTRIVWARGLSDADIAGLLQMKLLESRVRRGTRVALLNELVHEIKYRLMGKKRERQDVEV